MNSPIDVPGPAVTVDYGLRFEQPALVNSLAYWRSCCRGPAMPRRQDIDPLDMRDFIGQVGLLDVGGEPGGARTYRVRLAGTNIESVFGRITGREIRESLPPLIAERWRTMFDVALATPAPVRCFGQIAFEDKTWLRYEVLLAPLVDDAEQTTMLFATVVIA